jgi:hypothetical protein
MAQSVGRWHLIAGTLVRSLVRPCEICGVQSDTVTGLSPENIIPPTLRTHVHLYFTLTRRTNGRGLSTLKKTNLFWKSGIFGVSYGDL